ncbi:hypothetical protein [Xanthomonas sp. LMG 12461]|uniref:hypothetical protein n=1 Tax=Xanthomonas sp. LMG 12461 TaxID=2014543 RepID=UPI001264BA92|nr:hypothetical protein [Xanthomonas sp. LMG 12461]KAB7765374.1 hypothetical protein CEK68_11775 [Xanthomonas sp. LMG 12461]
MSWPYWLVGVVIVLLLCLAFRRKVVADYVDNFFLQEDAIKFSILMDKRNCDCFISYKPMSSRSWQVRCYRRKERSE